MKQLREGISTGSCMTAGALAAAIWLRTGKCPEWVSVDTPIGKQLKIEIEAIRPGTCGVIKDGGDDPDATHGCKIITTVSFTDEHLGEIHFYAGTGVGTITQAGLKLPPGEPAINPVPRQMAVSHLKPYLNGQGADITVSVPEGEEIAKKTFNPRLGITGGISILGTTGIVRPMSEDAVKDSLALELSVLYEKGYRTVVFVTGNQGHQMLCKAYGPLEPVIMVGNHIGFMIEKAADLGIEGIVIGGQYGKLMKLAGGIMNTHSHVADGKMEILCTHAALQGAGREVIEQIYQCRTVREASAILEQQGFGHIWQILVEKAEERTTQCGRNELQTAVIFTGPDGRILAESSHVSEAIEKVVKQV